MSADRQGATVADETKALARFFAAAVDADFPEGRGLDSDGCPVSEAADIAELLAEGDRGATLNLLADLGINDDHDALRTALEAPPRSPGVSEGMKEVLTGERMRRALADIAADHGDAQDIANLSIEHIGNVLAALLEEAQPSPDVVEWLRSEEAHVAVWKLMADEGEPGAGEILDALATAFGEAQPSPVHPSFPPAGRIMESLRWAVAYIEEHAEPDDHTEDWWAYASATDWINHADAHLAALVDRMEEASTGEKQSEAQPSEGEGEARSHEFAVPAPSLAAVVAHFESEAAAADALMDQHHPMTLTRQRHRVERDTYRKVVEQLRSTQPDSQPPVEQGVVEATDFRLTADETKLATDLLEAWLRVAEPDGRIKVMDGDYALINKFRAATKGAGQ